MNYYELHLQIYLSHWTGVRMRHDNAGGFDVIRSVPPTETPQFVRRSDEKGKPSISQREGATRLTGASCNWRLSCVCLVLLVHPEARLLSQTLLFLKLCAGCTIHILSCMSAKSPENRVPYSHHIVRSQVYQNSKNTPFCDCIHVYSPVASTDLSH